VFFVLLVSFAVKHRVDFTDGRGISEILIPCFQENHMAKAQKLSASSSPEPGVPTFGVFAPGDPRIDKESRQRCVNIVGMVAEVIAAGVKLPDGRPVNVVWSPILVDGEPQADQVAGQFLAAGVNALVCAPDTWAFPQLTAISVLSRLPKDIPLNITCGNSGPKPGVVYAHALNGALAQSGILAHLNVGTWPDTGGNPIMTESTAGALLDWCYAALTFTGLRGRRVVIFGHDSMGMETALAHVLPTRRFFGLEITRLDMKLPADMLAKKAYDKTELKGLREWVEDYVGKRLELPGRADSERFDQSLAMYLIVRDLLLELNAVGGGFMSQLEWGSDKRGLPLPVADAMESLFNSTFDHNGLKPAMPFATEADVQALLTMLFMTWLSGGQPPLFMDFRKVWEPWEIRALARKLRVKAGPKDLWATRGFVDGDNSGSASFNWAANPGASIEECMAGVSMPLADPGYFPGGGNSVTFMTPGGIEGIAARLAFAEPGGMFSLVWDEARTTQMPARLAKAVAATSTPAWPHTFVAPKYATMAEYKQYAPANHFHMTWGLSPARLEYWMDLANVLSVTPWSARPAWVEGADRPVPLLHLLNGGEALTKRLRAK
jgi:L-fucose isomerase